jgi:TonB family protein
MTGRSVWIVFAAALLFPALTLAQESTPTTSDTTSPGHEKTRPQGETQVRREKFPEELTSKNLFHKVQPEYPAEALAAKIGGTVVFHAILSTDGSVKEVQVVSGPPQLIDAATKAVKQWKYAPVTFDSEAVEIDTTISVVFNLFDPTGTGKTFDPQLRADIMHLFHSMRGFDAAEAAFEDEFDQVRRKIAATPSLGANRKEIIEEWTRGFFTTIRLPAFMDGVVAIYAKHFTDEEIKAIDQFYQTPAGQRFAMESPEINAESAAMGRQFAKDHLPDVLSELCKEFPELEGYEKICPSDTTDKQSQLTTPPRGKKSE